VYEGRLPEYLTRVLGHPMRGLLSGMALWDFVLSYGRTAFRLEMHEHYRERDEIMPLARFLSGQPDYAWNQEWADMIRVRTAFGEPMSRVRIVSEPHSDYTRFGLDLARINVEAGEDIRYLPRDQAAGLDLPDHDFWLIDDRRVAILKYSDGFLLGGRVSDKQPVVDEYIHWRDVAWAAAVPFAMYDG
jgi:Family of unknown function (DUF6879)